MKKLIASLLILSFLPLQGFAALTNPDRAEFTGRNLLADKNPGAENGKAGWTVSAGSFTASTSSPLEGGASFVWDATAASQTFTGTAVTIPEGWKGQNGVISCRFQCASGTCAHTLTAWDGANNIVTPQAITSSTTGAPRSSVNFIFPTSGTIAPRVTSSADEPSLKTDSCIIGLANDINLSQVSQAQFMGAVVITACAGAWSTTSTTLVDPSTQASCSYAVSGQASAPATNLPAIKFANGLPPGEYVLQYEGLIEQNVANKLSYFQFTDGTNAARELSQFEGPATNAGSPGITQSISYANAQGSTTFKIQMKTSSGGTAAIYGQSTFPGVIKVYRFPTSSQTDYRPDQTPASWSGYHDNTCSWSRTNTAYGDPTADTTCALVERTNRNFGTVTSYLSGSDKLPGLVITPPRPGKYRVEGCFSAFGPASSTVVLNYELSEVGGTVLAENYLQTQNASQTAMAICVKGDYLATNSTSKTFRLRMKSDSGVNTVVAPATNTSSIEWTVLELDAAMPTPFLQNTVSSNTSGQERIERATINVSGAATASIVSQSGSWISSVSAAASVATVNITAGEWSSAPSCTCTPHGLITDGEFCRMNSSPTTSVLTFYTEVSTTAKNDKIDIICMGPR